MIKTLHAIFDGKVLRKEPPYPLTQIRDIATDVGVDDLSTRHDWYAHGRRDDEKQ